KELIQNVVNAGRYAPSGANSQTSHFIVITNKEALKEKADGILMTDRKEFI
ncbi:MAG: nitroreductase family protein, partial [Ruminococcus sp.]|nr:nitroreductase family protein [Ruminococcus sp.]